MNKRANLFCLTIISIFNFIPKLEAEWNENSALIVNQDPRYHQYYFPRSVVQHPNNKSLVYYRWTSDTFSISHYFCPNPEYFNSNFRYCLFGEEFFLTDKQPMKICSAPVESVIVKIREENKEISCGRGNYKGSLYEVHYDLCKFVRTPWWNLVKKLKNFGKEKEKKTVYIKTVEVYKFCFKDADAEETSSITVTPYPSDSSGTSDATETADTAQAAEAALDVEATEIMDTSDVTRVAGEQLYSYFKIHAPKLLKTEYEFLLEEQMTKFSLDTNPYDIFEDDFFEEMKSIYKLYDEKYYPQMVASPKFRAFALARKPHFHYSNVKPILTDLRLPWNKMLKNLVDKIAEVKISISMYFGTFEVIERLELKNGRFLNVPGIWWVLMRYQKSEKSPRKGVSILMSNKKDSKQPIYCHRSICAEVGLQNVVFTSDEAFIYCCPASVITDKLGLPQTEDLLKFNEEKNK